MFTFIAGIIQKPGASIAPDPPYPPGMAFAPSPTTTNGAQK
jgi:hypothetical protein